MVIADNAEELGLIPERIATAVTRGLCGTRGLSPQLSASLVQPLLWNHDDRTRQTPISAEVASSPPATRSAGA